MNNLTNYPISFTELKSQNIAQRIRLYKRESDRLAMKDIVAKATDIAVGAFSTADPKDAAANFSTYDVVVDRIRDVVNDLKYASFEGLHISSHLQHL